MVQLCPQLQRGKCVQTVVQTNENIRLFAERSEHDFVQSTLDCIRHPKVGLILRQDFSLNRLIRRRECFPIVL